MMLRILLLVALFIAQPLMADTDLKVGGLSKHLTTKNVKNEFHRTFWVQSNNLSAAYSRNSWDQDIFILGGYYESKFDKFGVKIHVGGVYGYSTCFGRPIRGRRVLCPIIAPEIEFNQLPLEPSITLFGDALVLNINLITN